MTARRGLVLVTKTCPVCVKEFQGRANQHTCGDKVCVKKWNYLRPALCECGRGMKVTCRRGCIHCEQADLNYYESIKRSHERRLKAEEKRVREEKGLIGFLTDWQKAENAAAGIKYAQVMNSVI